MLPLSYLRPMMKFPVIESTKHTAKSSYFLITWKRILYVCLKFHTLQEMIHSWIEAVRNCYICRLQSLTALSKTFSADKILYLIKDNDDHNVPDKDDALRNKQEKTRNRCVGWTLVILLLRTETNSKSKVLPIKHEVCENNTDRC